MTAFAEGIRDLFLQVPGIVWGAAVTSLAGLGVGRLQVWWRRRRARSLWPFQKFDALSIVVSLTEAKKLPGYDRPQTGLGEVQAVGVIAPTLERASRGASLPQISVAVHNHDQLEGDLIAVGGPVHSELAAMLMTAILEGTGISQTGALIAWGGVTHRAAHRRDEGKQRELVEDYALVIRAKNPFNPERVAVVFSGGHTYGTIAAAKWYAKSERDRHSLPRSRENFVALIHCRVSGHLVTEPKLMMSMTLP